MVWLGGVRAALLQLNETKEVATVKALVTLMLATKCVLLLFLQPRLSPVLRPISLVWLSYLYESAIVDVVSLTDTLISASALNRFDKRKSSIIFPQAQIICHGSVSKLWFVSLFVTLHHFVEMIRQMCVFC